MGLSLSPLISDNVLRVSEVLGNSEGFGRRYRVAEPDTSLLYEGIGQLFLPANISKYVRNFIIIINPQYRNSQPA